MGTRVCHQVACSIQQRSFLARARTWFLTDDIQKWFFSNHHLEVQAFDAVSNGSISASTFFFVVDMIINFKIWISLGRRSCIMIKDLLSHHQLRQPLLRLDLDELLPVLVRQLPHHVAGSRYVRYTLILVLAIAVEQAVDGLLLITAALEHYLPWVILDKLILVHEIVFSGLPVDWNPWFAIQNTLQFLPRVKFTLFLKFLSWCFQRRIYLSWAVVDLLAWNVHGNAF